MLTSSPLSCTLVGWAWMYHASAGPSYCTSDTLLPDLFCLWPLRVSATTGPAYFSHFTGHVLHLQVSPRLPHTMALDVSPHILALDPFPVKAPILHHPLCGTLVLHATQGQHVSSHFGPCIRYSRPVMHHCGTLLLPATMGPHVSSHLWALFYYYYIFQ